MDADGKYVPEKSHLDAFFRLNQTDRAARRLYYFQIPEHYSWQASGDWQLRRSRCNTIGRLCNVDVRFTERYHLRLLLLNVKGPRNYDELKMVSGIVHKTYASACVARGLARDDQEWQACMEDASAWKMERQLRQLFAMILAWNSPKDPLKLWEEFRDVMSNDFRRRHNYTVEQAYAAAYAEIVAELAEYGKSLRDFPTLPQVWKTFVSCT